MGLILLYSFWYLVITTGVLVSVHKCGGQVVSVEFFKAKADACSSSGCESGGCCENETHFYKVTDDQKLSSAATVPDLQLLFVESVELPELRIAPVQSYVVPSKLPIRPPPDLVIKTPLYIRNRVLIV
jgi:hypothetical protein